MDAKSFGAFIADQRRTLGLTQAEVAARLHVTDKAVSRWERGVGLPDINTLEPLADVLGLTLADLMHCHDSRQKDATPPVPLEDFFTMLLSICFLRRAGMPVNFSVPYVCCYPSCFVWQGFCYVRTALQFCGMSAHRSSLLPTPQSSLSFLLRHCCNVWRYFSGTFVMPIYHFGKRNFLHGSVLFSPGFRNLSGFCAKPCSSSFLAL